MARQPILLFDFEKTPFDGDPRQAHQFIPFLLGKLGAAQLSYILNSQQYPDPEIPEYALLKEREHSMLQDLAATEYKEEMEAYSHNMLVREVELSHIKRTVQDPDDRARQLAAKPPLPLPKLRDVPLLGITSGDLSKTREQIRRYDAAADQALQIIKSLLSSSPSFHLAYSTCALPSLTTPSALRVKNFSKYGNGFKAIEVSMHKL